MLCCSAIAISAVLAAGAQIPGAEVRALADREEELGVAQPGGLGLRRLVEPVDRVLANRVSSMPSRPLPHRLTQALDDQRLECVQVGTADRLRRLEREASVENGEPHGTALARSAPAARSSTRSSHAAFAVVAGASRDRDESSGSRLIEPRQELLGRAAP